MCVCVCVCVCVCEGVFKSHRGHRRKLSVLTFDWLQPSAGVMETYRN